jgi:hypothetical protein
MMTARRRSPAKQRLEALRISPAYRMRNRSLPLALGLITVLFAVCAPARAQTNIASLPAHDVHEGVLVAADPYVSAARYQEKFGKHTPFEAGVLALEIYARNDSDKPIRINLNTVSLLFAEPGQARQKIAALSPEEVANRVLLKKARDPKPQRLPLPLPGRVPRTGRGKDYDELYAALSSAAMSSDVLPPNSTVHGFFYFDIDRHYDWLSNARFELPDLAFMLDNKALFFFEVDLAPAVR